MTATDPTGIALQRWLDTHAPATDHDQRVIDGDFEPGTSRRPVGDEDTSGQMADRAAEKSARRVSGA